MPSMVDAINAAEMADFIMGNSKEVQLAYQIKRRLNDSAMNLPAGAAERLRAARERALGVQRRSAPQAVIAGVPFGFAFAWMGKLAPLALLLLGLGGMHLWHQSQQAVDIADIDIQMLADELPPNAYLDKGFGAWLTRPEQGRSN